MPWITAGSTPIATVASRSARSATSGRRASTPRPATAGITYSRFIEGLKAAKCELDRKIISDLAATDAAAFGELVKLAQDALKTKAAKVGEGLIQNDSMAERATSNGRPFCFRLAASGIIAAPQLGGPVSNSQELMTFRPGGGWGGCVFKVDFFFCDFCPSLRLDSAIIYGWISRRHRTAQTNRARGTQEPRRTSRRLEQTKGAWIGPNGKFTALMKQLGTLSKEEKPAAGKAHQRRQGRTRSRAGRRREELELNAALPKEPTDFTLPGRRRALGKLHPLTQVTEDIVRAFRKIGFVVADGPEIEDEYHCFDALNTPADHPARDTQDTFYLANA